MIFDAQIDDKDFIQAGEKVKLNYDLITNRPSYAGLTQKYIDWIEANKNNVFTVECVPNYEHKNPVIVQLVEDESFPKWLFWIGDLVRVESGENGNNTDTE